MGKGSPVHLHGEILFVTFNFHHQSDWIWKHLRDTLLSMVLRKLQQRFDCWGKTHPKCGQDHPIVPQLNRKWNRRKRAEQQHSSLYASWPKRLSDGLLPPLTTAPSCQLRVSSEIYPSSCKLPMWRILSQQWEKKPTHYLSLKKNEPNSSI